MRNRGKWASPTAAMRKRKIRGFTLSDEAYAKLDELAGHGGKSALVERLILEAYARRG